MSQSLRKPFELFIVFILQFKSMISFSIQHERSSRYRIHWAFYLSLVKTAKVHHFYNLNTKPKRSDGRRTQFKESF